MPVQELTAQQVAQYGRFAETPSQLQLVKYFHLDDRDIQNINAFYQDHTRLGFAIQLGVVRFLGVFLSDQTEIPSNVVAYVAAQLKIETVEWSNYGKRSQRRHKQVICQLYGYENFHQSKLTFSLMRQIYNRARLTQERYLVLFDFATAWLVHNQVLLPGATVLERWLARIINRAEQRLWNRIVATINDKQKQQLESLLEIDEESRFSKLELLRRQANRFSAPVIKETMDRLVQVRAIKIDRNKLIHIPVGHLKALARYGRGAWAAAIEDLSDNHKLAVLLATVMELEALVQDELIDLFILNVSDKFKIAEKEGIKARLRTLAMVDLATIQLCTVCSLVLDDAILGNQLRNEIFDLIPKPELEKAVTTVQSEASPHAPTFYNLLSKSYRSLRIFLPLLLKTLNFESVEAGKEILNSWEFLHQLDFGRPRPNLQDAPVGIITQSAWRAVIFDQNKQIDRRYYTFCVVQKLIKTLQRRDVFIAPSQRWHDQRSQLLRDESWRQVKKQVSLALGRQTDGNAEIKRLSKQLDTLYRQVAKRFGENDAVSIKKVDDFERISLTKPSALPESNQLKQLKKHISNLLPEVDLPELLLEIDQLTNFTREFTHISETEARADDFPLSLCAALLAEACNVGIGDVINPEIPALRRNRLLWVQQNYIRSETITRANAKLVEAQAQILLAKKWGGGHVASADGQRFVVPVQSLNAAANWKYFGQGKGVTYFTFMSDQFSSFYGVVIPGAVREALYILDGLLEQQTILEPVEVMTDTAGYTDIVFGLFWLLGYQFSPRLRDIGKTRFWRINKKARYGKLNKIARHQINTSRIINNWDDQLRVAGSLKLNQLTASEFMKTLQASKGASELAKAIAETGRIAKTIYLLNYIDDAGYRRRISIQLNHGEQRHQLARRVFHGRSGQLWQKYQDGQEDQLGTLGLVVNIIVLWNTLYMNKIISYLTATGRKIDDDHFSRLTPLAFKHIRMTGRYDFTLRAKPESGGLRPLRGI